MVYLKNFTILSREQEERILDSIRETCYTTRYPFNIFRYRDVPQLEFEPLTIFYGGNGSGKTTLLNIIAERLHLSRETVFNRSSFFEDYVRECSYKMTFGKIAPPGSRIITSDDVFDYLLDIRYSDRNPAEWNIAIDKNASRQRTRIDYPSIKAYRLEPALLSIGVTRGEINFTDVRIYDRDRTICDVLRNMNKMDKEIFNKAIQGYVNDPQKNVPNLIEYAKTMRVWNKVKNLIGVWL